MFRPFIAAGLGPAAGLLLLAAAGSAQAQPAGSYQRTCRVLEVAGGRLTAACRSVSGRERTSTLDSSRCRGDIGNADGLLQCSGATGVESGGRGGYDDDRGGRGGRGGYDDGYARGGTPQGSYQRSCRDVRYSGGRLSASCNDGRGRWSSTSIEAGACRGDIGNSAGRLICNGALGTQDRGRDRDDRRGYDDGRGYDSRRNYDGRGGYDDRRGDNGYGSSGYGSSGYGSSGYGSSGYGSGAAGYDRSRDRPR